MYLGWVAHLVEQWIENPRVIGSIPISATGRIYGCKSRRTIVLRTQEDTVLQLPCCCRQRRSRRTRCNSWLRLLSRSGVIAARVKRLDRQLSSQFGSDRHGAGTVSKTVAREFDSPRSCCIECVLGLQTLPARVYESLIRTLRGKCLRDLPDT